MMLTDENIRKLGDYSIGKPLFISECCTLYEGKQSSADDRSVIICIPFEQGIEFESLIKIKAAESVSSACCMIFEWGKSKEGVFFYSQERPAGEPLTVTFSTKSIKPIVCFKILDQLAKVYKQWEYDNVAVERWMPTMVYWKNDTLRLLNIGKPGNYTFEMRQRDMKLMGEYLAPILKEGEQGYTRALCLCRWLCGERDEYTPDELTWSVIQEICAVFFQQVQEESKNVEKNGKSKKLKKLFFSCVLVLFVVMLVVYLYLR